MEDTKKKVIKVPSSVSLYPHTWEKLDQLAKQSGRSRSSYIQEVMNYHLSQKKF